MEVRKVRVIRDSDNAHQPAQVKIYKEIAEKEQDWQYEIQKQAQKLQKKYHDKSKPFRKQEHKENKKGIRQVRSKCDNAPCAS